MLIYVAHPIDRANPTVRTKVSGALAALGGGRAHLNGNHMYIPSAAFKLGPGCQPDSTINTINDTALDEAPAVLALWPRDAKSWGLPIEVNRAIRNGKRVALVIEDDPTWAMQYDGDLELFKVDPREYDGFTMATLRAMDWLTGWERNERSIYRTPKEVAETIRGDDLMMDTSAPHPASASRAGYDPILVAVHTEAEFLGSAVSEGATEALTQTGEDESTPEPSECKEDPKKGPGEVIGFRNLIHYGEDADVSLPTRGYKSDAGLDIYVSEDTTVEPNSFVDVRSHTAVNLPEGTWGYLVGRSSTLRKKGLLVNPGVIDNGYTGELYSAVWNLTSEPVKVLAGERIAQLILMSNITPDFDPQWVGFTNESERGSQGFGSSGV